MAVSACRLPERQMGLESILRDGAGRLRYLAGYSWGVPQGIHKYVHGMVATPRWVDRAVKEYPWPIMLDNGAFPAWRDGIEKCPVEMLVEMRAACERHGERIKWLIAPDVVAAGERSWAVTRHAVAKMRPWVNGRRVMLPVQDGQDMAAVARFARAEGCDVFVGGSTYEFKRQACDELHRIDPSLRIHVARIWKDGDLHWHSSRAVTFDNTTYVRSQHFNRRLDVASLADRYLERVAEAS